MNSGCDLSLYLARENWAVVGDIYPGSPSEIEEFIRQKRVNKLRISLPNRFRDFPCVTFITRLDILRIGTQTALGVGNAIRAMTILRTIVVSFSDSSSGRCPITDAIASHPSLKKVEIFGWYNNDVRIITRRNPGIVSYTLGALIRLGYEYGDVLVLTTQINQFLTVGGKIIFRDGDFLRFIRGNPGLRRISMAVSRVSEVAAALEYLNAIEELRIECGIRDDVSGLRTAMIGVLARCHSKSIVIYDGREWINASTVWPNHCVIYCRNLPKRNYEWSASVCDVHVHVSRC